MATHTESAPVIESMLDVNHKEAYSETEAVAVAKVNDENSVVEKVVFAEAPIPKVNPWTVNRNAAQIITGGPPVKVDPISRTQPLGK